MALMATSSGIARSALTRLIAVSAFVANTNIMHIGKSFIKAVIKMKVQNNKEGDLTLFEKSLILVKVYCNCRDGTEDKEPGSAANGDNG